MTADDRSDIEAKSKELEDKSGIQLVVATVKSLQGSDIETYANQLFRFWKLGEAKKNNGVLLLVAPKEHKVRIEVGYGLEGTLTDAASSVDHLERDGAAIQGRRFFRRHHRRRRRHHQRAHRRRHRLASQGQRPRRRVRRPISPSCFRACFLS